MAYKTKFSQSEVKALLDVAKRVSRLATCDILVAPAAKSQGRVLVVTPRRIGSSPQRNTVRRRIKAVFRTYCFDQMGYDCVFIVKHQGVRLSSAGLAEVTHLYSAK